MGGAQELSSAARMEHPSAPVLAYWGPSLPRSSGFCPGLLGTIENDMMCGVPSSIASVTGQLAKGLVEDWTGDSNRGRLYMDPQEHKGSLTNRRFVKTECQRRLEAATHLYPFRDPLE